MAKLLNNTYRNIVLKLYWELRRKHGRPAGQWSLWCKRPTPRLRSGSVLSRVEAPQTIREKEEVIIGAILTQRTNWKNVELAIARLEEAGYASLRKIYLLGKTNPRKLAELIKPSGFYKTKSRYLFGVAKFFVEKGGISKVSKMPLPKLREELLDLRGVGPETADSILLYALEKPVFVVDEYTRRLVRKKRLSKNLSYNALQKLFEDNLPRDWRLYQDFHALIVIDGKMTR